MKTYSPATRANSSFTNQTIGTFTMLHHFTDHPASVDETYTEHMAMALSFAGPLFLAALCALVHAFLPFVFEKSSSKIVTRLYERMVANRNVKKPVSKVVDGARPA